jgi:predicted nucleotidyltransferase component of viral defense system
VIEKNEVTAMANGLSLNLDTIEKDYVLGWLLWGINNHKDLSSKWLFKGGTSLKKCFFDTFRFSEDLDFTVTDEKHLSKDFLHETFHQISENIYEETGIEFFKEHFRFKILPKESGKLSAQGVIHYNGPLRRRQGATANFASVKLDLTTSEIIVLQPQIKNVYHPYSDVPQAGIWANCYAFEEVIAEKIRALGERLRPRDLYDVIHFLRNKEMIENPQLVYNILTKKCGYKKIVVPTYAHVENHDEIEALAAQWDKMLAHQLPMLPPMESFWQELKPFFSWLEGTLQEHNLVEAQNLDGEIFHPDFASNTFAINAIIHKIQFAAANRELCPKVVFSILSGHRLVIN